MRYLQSRLREPSTWAGLAAIIASGAQAWQTRGPGAIGATVAGLAAILRPEAAHAPAQGAPRG